LTGHPAVIYLIGETDATMIGATYPSRPEHVGSLRAAKSEGKGIEVTADVMALILGLTALVVGGELLVRGASRIALVCGVSPLVIGLTVVAFGTSSPEAAVSVFSSLRGATGVAVGNVLGSNIFNILVVLGVSALVAPLKVHQQVVRFDAPLGVGVTLLLAGLSIDGNIGRLDGAILFGGILVYTFWAVRKSRTESLEIQQEYAKEFGSRVQRRGHIALQALFIAAGVGLLVFGSDRLVDGASAMAGRLGVSDLIIGLTIVAAGTSLPEVATSVIAGIRGERDIAVGNAIGSNLFNILCVLGLAGLVAPRGLPVPPEALRFDLWVMLGSSALALPVFFTGYRISRWEGAVFVMFYILYLGFLVLSASGRPALAAFNTSALVFIVPMVVLIIGTAVYQLLVTRKK
jgi:cation:H+ antiporter